MSFYLHKIRKPLFSVKDHPNLPALDRDGGADSLGKDRWKARRSLEDESMDVAAPSKTRAAADGGQRWSW